MNSINAIKFLRSIDFPADSIAGPEFLANLPTPHSTFDALTSIFARPIILDTPTLLTNLSDSDWDDLDDILYPTD